MKKLICLLCVISLCCTLPVLGGASHVVIDAEEDALAFAETFFASPYVNESPDGRTLNVEQTEGGWHAVLADPNGALPALTLRFTADGRIAQYENSAYPLPFLDNFTMEEMPVTDNAVMIDMIRDALFPYMNNHACGVFARDGDAVFFSVDNLTEWLGIVMNIGTPKIVAYGDFGTDEACYPGYITHGEAEALAVTALADAYGTGTDLAQNLVLMQGEFILQEHRWTDADVPLPYWFFLFGDETDGLKSQYTALIDAQTGEVLEVHDPSETGNG